MHDDDTRCENWREWYPCGILERSVDLLREGLDGEDDQWYDCCDEIPREVLDAEDVLRVDNDWG